MAITEADIKILKSERMQDTDDGGGRMTGVAVVDGQSNNIFPDISELDRTYGRVNLRKVFPAVLTSNTDTYYGANIIVAEPPQDEAVHAAMFRLTTADAFFNTRATARDKLESYVTLGALSPMRLVGDHYEGQRSILCYQLLTDPLPDAGAVYAVKYGTIIQYVRVLRVESRTVTYYDDKGEFQRNELTIQISDPLRSNFPGGVVSRYSSYVPPTVIHRTNVVEAVSYYGVAPLALAAGLGDREIRVARYKTPLVPSTQSESAMLDVRAGSVRTLTVSGGARSTELAVATQSVGTAVTAENRGYTYVKQLVPKPAPKTLEVAYRSRDRWYLIYDSAGDGSLAGDGAGTINYTTGSVTVTLKDLPDMGTTLVWSWGGTTEFFQGTQADVDLPAWRHTTAHTPVAPGTVTVTWLAGGSTKTATDTGTGTFTGDGTGTILYATGEVVLRPNSLPDPQTTPEIEYDVYESVTETFNDVTVTNNQAQVILQQQPAPQPIEVRFQVARNFQHEARIVCEGQTCEPKVTTTIAAKNGATLYFDYFFSASLNIYVFNIRMTSGANGELPFGAVDFQTKTLTLPTNLPILTDYAVYETECSEQWNGTTQVTVCRHVFDHYEWNTNPTTTGALPGGKTHITATYRTTGADQETYTEEIPAQNIVVRLAPRTTAEVVPGTVQFVLNGSTYIDIEGEMHKDPNPQTGVGTPAGTLDYQTGDATLTLWTAGTLSFTLQSLALQRYPRLDSGLFFRTAAPARPASLTLAVLARNGDLLTADAELDGDITGDWAEGFIDVQTGSARVRFGQWVQASSLSDEEKQGWFSQNQVRSDGYVWKPRLVRLDTARYNLVVYVYLPLSADILGLDPVRLPMDGKVPIFRVGDVIVVHHTQSTTISNPYNGQIIDTGRVRLSYARLYEADGDPVPTDKYSVNLNAGTVTLIDVSGLTTPLQLEDRIEDMALVSDLQINGTLTLTRALSHAYPLGSYVSSAIVLGDLWARVGAFFSQATWTGVWSDERIGSDTTGKYNRTAYPVELTNKGTITERWAIIFTSSTAFKLVGEYVGQIALGDINTDFSPMNPETNEPYFTIRAGGWGSGWATGNVVRMNTIGANYPIWIVRTVLQSEAASGSDRFRLCVRGDVDTP